MTGCSAVHIEPHHNPEEGRNIINNNFDCIEATIADIQATESTGATIVTAGTNIAISQSFSGVVPVYQVSTVNDPIFDSLSSTTISAGTYYLGSTDLTSLIIGSSNSLISGGASWISGLTFSITPLTYIIGQMLYSSPGGMVTLSSGSPIADRIDVIIADVSGNTGVVEGTAAASPVKPDIDESTQVEVTFVTVNASATTPAVTTTLVYDEAAGPPDEWTFSTTTPVYVNSASTTQAYSGTKSIEFSASTNGKTLLLSASTPFDTVNENVLQFAIRNRVSWPATTKLRFALKSAAGVQIGSVVDLYNTRFGFSSSNISAWQLIAIPLSNFNLTTTVVSELTITAIGTGLAALNLYVDFIRFQQGVPSVTPVNNWRNIRGDATTTIVAPTPNSTLILSGGNNIASRVSGANTVVYDLDPNIFVTNVTAAKVIVTGATAPLNIPVLPLTFTSVTNGDCWISASGSTGSAFLNIVVSGSTKTVELN